MEGGGTGAREVREGWSSIQANESDKGRGRSRQDRLQWTTSLYLKQVLWVLCICTVQTVKAVKAASSSI